MWKMFSALIFSAITAAALARVYLINNDPETRAWPIKTICPLCKKRIWRWQPHERRDAIISLHNPGNLEVSASKFATVHKTCAGSPSIVLRVRDKKNTLNQSRNA